MLVHCTDQQNTSFKGLLKYSLVQLFLNQVMNSINVTGVAVSHKTVEYYLNSLEAFVVGVGVDVDVGVDVVFSIAAMLQSVP